MRAEGSHVGEGAVLGGETQTPLEGTACSCLEAGGIPAAHLPTSQLLPWGHKDAGY